MTSEPDLLGKRVLLVDDHQRAREVRAHRLNVYGIAVDAVSTIGEARFCVRDNSYDLVLLAARDNPEETISFQRELRQQDPQQRVAFLVGPPHYISFSYGQKVIPMPFRSSTWAEKKRRLASA